MNRETYGMNRYPGTANKIEVMRNFLKGVRTQRKELFVEFVPGQPTEAEWEDIEPGEEPLWDWVRNDYRNVIQ